VRFILPIFMMGADLQTLFSNLIKNDIAGFSEEAF
jgi:hypothetical protein